MATTQYIGARYVPLFADPAEWDSTKQYEPLTIVIHNGNSYTSRQYVPAGIDITNEKFWALTGNYNAQVEQYRKEVADYKNLADTTEEHLATIYPLDTTPTDDSTKGVTSDGIKKAITTAVYDETTRAKEAEHTNATAISAETTRATEAEQTLQNNINTNATKITKISNEFYVELEDFGGKGEANFDNTNALKLAIATGNPIKLRDGLIYGFDGKVNAFTANSINIYSNCGATLKSILGSQSGAQSFNDGQWVFNGNTTLKNLTFDAGGEYVQRPVVESGTDWDNYIAQRIKSHNNTVIHGQANVLNCTFTNGVHGLDVYDCENGLIIGCKFTYQIADSLYISDRCYKILVANCYAEYNGDDAFCANVNGGNTKGPENITFVNCRGEHLFGALCESFGGTNIVFMNCSGSTSRTSGLRCDFPLRSTYGNRPWGNISFIRCTVNAFGGSLVYAQLEDIDYQLNVTFDDCTFNRIDGTSTVLINNCNGVTVKNCILNDMLLYTLETNNIIIHDNIIKANGNPIRAISSINISIQNNMLIDKGNGKYYNGTDEVSIPCIILINYDTRNPDDGKHGPATCYISGNTTMGAKNGYEILDITKYNNVAGRNIWVDTTNVKITGQPDTAYHVYHFKVPVNLDQLSIPNDNYLREDCLYFRDGHVYFEPHGHEAILLG